MKLFRRKQEQNSVSEDRDNPFSDRKGHEIRIIDLDFEAEPEALSDPDAYFRAVSAAAQRFPWFGRVSHRTCTGNRLRAQVKDDTSNSANPGRIPRRSPNDDRGRARPDKPAHAL